ncbi:MAG: bL32 family ribosomal protein [Chloroflexota bacterium]|nr:bL32 family ribosomal protein [Chloroflexota bacterium]
MTWLIWIFTALMLIWMIGGSSSNADNCNEYAIGTSSRSACEAGTDIGTGIGVALLFMIWFIGFIILSIIWFMTRPNRRTCPICGNEVKKGRTVCKKCGYDFASAQQFPHAGQAQ